MRETTLSIHENVPEYDQEYCLEPVGLASSKVSVTLSSAI